MPRPGKRSGRPVRVGDLLGASLPRESGGQGALVAIVRAWPDAVGDAIARHAWPARMRGQELIAHAESSVWVTELQLLAEMIAVRLRDAAGGSVPSAVRFQVGPVPVRDGPAERLPAPVSEATRRQAAAIASAIRDDALRTSAEQAIAGALARADSA
jgi:hypothetical protein